jgi:transposase InsO family protein
LVFDHEPGFHHTCPICGWEDDLSQLRFPLMPGSSNRVSLHEAQRNYMAFGAAERRNRGQTREPVEGEVLDPDWRPLDLGQDNIEEPMRGVRYADSYPWPDTTVLYYWRATYWRRVVS